jgi:branched-chain amino acid transport system ATP-binding protein
MLELKNIKAAYGKSVALNGVDIAVSPGEVVCLIGRNGAGKSSLMRAIVSDNIDVLSGQVRFYDQDITQEDPYRIIRKGIGYVPENRRVFANLSVLDNLKVSHVNPPHDGKGWTIDDVYALFPQLHEYRNRIAGVMSGGEQQMLSIARSLLTNPKLLLLDEPHEGLAPKVAEEVVHAIIELKKRGVSMIISEQALHTIKKCADQVYVMDRGLTVWNGSVQDFYDNPQIKEKHLMVQ